MGPCSKFIPVADKETIASVSTIVVRSKSMVDFARLKV